MKIRLCIASIIGCLLFMTVTGSATVPKQVQNNLIPSLSPMLKKVSPAIVNIVARGKTRFMPKPTRDDDDADDEGDDNYDKNAHKRKFTSIGSGVIIDARKGYIVTNAHVIKNSSRIIVTLGNSYRYHAKLIGSDPGSDVALLQIKAENLTAARLGNSNNLHVGDFVAAIGNPFGLKQTVTSGIISALGRSGLGIEGYEDFIQTDASINPGNSGGALINMNGEVIGINTAIFAPGGLGNIGIGFAIPSNMVKGVMTQLIKYGEVRRGLLGIYVQPLTPELANAFGIEGHTQGALINQISLHSPASRSGLKVGDVIIAVNGTLVKSGAQVRNIIGMKRMGSKFKLAVLRKGKKYAFSIHTQNPEAYVKETHTANPFLYGAALKNFEAELPIQGHIKGVRVIALDEASPSWQAGIRPGDVIISTNQQNVDTIEQLDKIARRSKEQLVVNLLRGQGALFLVVKP